ncbi:fumarylacetoacetate hydrolase family protein [Corallococcus sp. BB11-1]|uniref:2-keto-4-pentenoate hydratase n=1 Tax=Corallococcus sp. BB11-1 TaxID=2996783 RepID=UPI0022721F2E|nr:fumarylacetoacetate hydrolase family protein [Corallococcus sp. BB11-1]MCY1036452.1 fumarylacetoacetate hydrolase family protein [Corallococcus sp. BB11-1]
MTSSADVMTLAQTLDAARRERREIPPLTHAHPSLSVPDGYAVQAQGIRLREAQGERRVGLKMGFTSEAKRQQMNLGSPIFGVLTDRMLVPSGGVVHVGAGIHPRIEPEIAFRTSKELKGTVTRDEVLDACSAVFAAMEVLDSRFVGFKYFSLPDVVADNASSSLFVPGTTERGVRELDLTKLQMRMEVNGRVEGEARSDAISGDPVVSLIQLCALLAERGEVLPAGSVVLSGAATAAYLMKPGDVVKLTVDGLGTVEVTARE